LFDLFASGRESFHYQVRLTKHILNKVGVSDIYKFLLISPNEKKTDKIYCDFLEALFGAIVYSSIRGWTYYGVAFNIAYSFFVELVNEYPPSKEELESIDYTKVFKESFVEIHKDAHTKNITIYESEVPESKKENYRMVLEVLELDNLSQSITVSPDQIELLVNAILTRERSNKVPIVEEPIVQESQDIIQEKVVFEYQEFEDVDQESKQIDQLDILIDETTAVDEKEDVDEEDVGQVSFDQQVHSTTECPPSDNLAVELKRTIIAGMMSVSSSGPFSGLSEDLKNHIRMEVCNIPNIHLLNAEDVLWYYIFLQDNPKQGRAVGAVKKFADKNKIDSSRLLRYVRFIENL
jgi:hypothetical protein